MELSDLRIWEKERKISMPCVLHREGTLVKGPSMISPPPLYPIVMIIE